MNPRLPMLRALVACLALALAPQRAAANELRTAAGHVAGIVVHDAAETLHEYCRSEDGRLWLELPGGSRWELVTSTTDPVIANPGDGAFHSFESAEVQAALDEVSFPMGGVSAEVFILPFPRRESLESAAGPGLILLSPGVRVLSREHQHSEFVHELGHVVQYALLPDADQDGWDRYMNLRGLSSDLNTATSPHADRPHEIWAEDFRALFGGPSANVNGTIENATLVHPAQVAGLSEFMRSVADAAPQMLASRLVAAPVASGAVSFSRFGTAAAVLDVFDAAGRRVASVQPTVGIGSVAWTWNGDDRSGRRLRGAVVFARVRDGRGGAVRVVVTH